MPWTKNAARQRGFEHEAPAATLAEPAGPDQPMVVGDITTARGRQKQMELAIAENVASFFADDAAPDLTLTARAIGVLAGLLLIGRWTTIVDLQLELEDRNVIIPMASLYPLLDRLAAVRLVARKDEQGAKGRPKAFYRITHTGRCAVSLGQAVAKSLVEEGTEANV